MNRKNVIRLSLVLMLAALIAVVAAAQVQKVGCDITVKDRTAVCDIVKTPETYKDKDVHVEGVVTKVCQESGCWFSLKDKDTEIVVKDPDHKLLVPKDCVGKYAVVQGKVVYTPPAQEASAAGARPAGCPFHQKQDAATTAQAAQQAAPAAEGAKPAGCPMAKASEKPHECLNPALQIRTAGVVLQDKAPGMPESCGM